MLFIELVGGSAPRFRLEFHPRLTVVVGLDATQRHELGLALRNVLTGRARHMHLTAEIGGQPRALDDDQVRYLGLDTLEFNNIVDEEGLAREAAGDSPAQAQEPPPPPKPIDPAMAAQQEVQAALRRVQQLTTHLSSLPPAPPAVDKEELMEAEKAAIKARSTADTLRSQLEASGAFRENELSSEEQLAQYEAIKLNIERKLAEARTALEEQPGDEVAIREALQDASNAEELLRERQEFATILGKTGGDWDRLQNEITRLSNQPRTPEWLVNQTKDELDEAEARVKALSYQLRTGIDVKGPLERAETRLAEAHVSWDELENGVEGQLVEAEVRLEELYKTVKRLLGFDVQREDVVDTLVAQHEELQNQPHPADALIDRLSEAGVVADVTNVVEKARTLLAQRDALANDRAKNQQIMASAMIDLRDLNERMVALRRRIAEEAENPVDDQKAHYEELLVIAREAEGRLSQLRLAQTAVDDYLALGVVELRSKLQGAHTLAAQAQQRYEQLTAPKPEQVESASDLVTEAELPEKPWWSGGVTKTTVAPTPRMDPNRMDVYLLARLASLRMIAHGESLPLVIDSIFEDMPGNAVVKTLDSLVKVSSIVQVVYLAGNDVAEKWAKRQDIYTTAVVRLEHA